jgi:membrane dipeptidase
MYDNNVSALNLRQPQPLDTDIPKLQAGKVGGQFWSVYVDCSFQVWQFSLNQVFIRSRNCLYCQHKDAVRATIEQIDVVRRMAAYYPDVFALALTSQVMRGFFMNNSVSFIERHVTRMS